MVLFNVDSVLGWFYAITVFVLLFSLGGSLAFSGTILNLRRLGRTTKIVEKRDAGELSCCLSLARSDKSAERALHNVRI